MDKEQLKSALQQTKEISPKRKFKQRIDLIINLRGIDLKKQDHKVDQFVTLTHSQGKKIKICAFVGGELLEQSKSVCDQTISVDDFSKYKDKKSIKKLASEYDFFIAQANIMPKVATVFGRVLGPRTKMPNPKSGAVVPPNANLKAVYDKFQKTVRVMTKNSPILQCGIGSEDMEPIEIIDNAMTIYNAIVHHLPNEKHNIKDIYVKLTMGKSVKVGEKEEIKKETK
jgi:large subunit ribosomal protein L1